jgi:hypothetical protein
MNRDQWALLARMNPTWGRLWLIADYETARRYIAGTGHSMSTGVQGQWCETDARGLRLLDRAADTVLVDLPWTTIRAWSNNLDDAAHGRAEQLQAEAARIRDAYPKPYPGIGRPYAWDRDDAAPDEHAADRAALEQANADLDARRAENLARQREHEAACRAFLDALGPTDEPQDLLELLALDTTEGARP